MDLRDATLMFLIESAAHPAVGEIAQSAYDRLVAGEDIDYRVLSDLVDLAQHWPVAGIAMQEALDHCNEILRDISAFAGLADNNMNRLSGWHFLQLGGCVERAINTEERTPPAS